MTSFEHLWRHKIEILRFMTSFWQKTYFIEALVSDVIWLTWFEIFSMVCIIVPGAGLGASELVGMLAVKGLKVQKSDRCYEVSFFFNSKSVKNLKYLGFCCCCCFRRLLIKFWSSSPSIPAFDGPGFGASNRCCVWLTSGEEDIVEAGVAVVEDFWGLNFVEIEKAYFWNKIVANEKGHVNLWFFGYRTLLWRILFLKFPLKNQQKNSLPLELPKNS